MLRYRTGKWPLLEPTAFGFFNTIYIYIPDLGTIWIGKPKRHLRHNYAHIFDLLTSLRRAVDHPYLIVYGGGQATHRLPQGKTLLAENAGNVCGLCQDGRGCDGLCIMSVDASPICNWIHVLFIYVKLVQAPSSIIAPLCFG